MSDLYSNYLDGLDTSVGPQTDGTNLVASAAITPSPADAGGGAPASYTKDVLDLFKYGIGAATSQKNYQNMLDYKRYEATQGGLYAQGRPTVFANSATGGSGSLLVMAALVIGVVILLDHKG